MRRSGRFWQAQGVEEVKLLRGGLAGAIEGSVADMGGVLLDSREQVERGARDRGILRLKKTGTDFQLKSKTLGDPLHGKAIKLSHTLDDACVKYHYDWFKAKRT